MNREQELIGIWFQILFTATEHPWFNDKNWEQTAKWAVETLRKCGFNTIPVGSSWGVLKNDTEN